MPFENDDQCRLTDSKYYNINDQLPPKIKNISTQYQPNIMDKITCSTSGQFNILLYKIT